MLLLLLKYLASLGIKIPAVFSYSSTRMMLAAITSLLATIVLGPAFIKKLYQLKTGQSIRVEDCPVLAELHKKKKDTPTMGGSLILFSMSLSLLLWMDLTNVFTLILLLVSLWLGGLGAIDDYLKMARKNAKGLNPKKKFGWQIVLSAVLSLYLFSPSIQQAISSQNWFRAPQARDFSINSETKQKVAVNLKTDEYMSRYYVPFYKEPLITLGKGALLLGGCFLAFVLTGASNAVNLTDGLDGLAAGTIVLTAVVLAVFAFASGNVEIARYLNILYIEGSAEIGIYLCGLIGGCLGFLWYNGHPAQIFMGDTGSLALGGVLGIAAILLRRELVLALAGGIFVIEAISVILQVGSYKLRNKRRIFLCAPLHHHFEYKGWSETKVVLRFWIIGLILAIIALLSIKFQ